MKLNVSDLYSTALNHVYIVGTISNESVDRLIRSVKNLQQPGEVESKAVGGSMTTEPKPIMIHIDSGGGDLEAGIRAVRFIKNSQTPIYTIVDGLAASSAASIYIAGHERFAFADSLILLHQHSVYTGHSESSQTHTDLKEAATESQAAYKWYFQYYLDSTSLDQKDLERLLRRDAFLQAKEAKLLKLIDSIVLPPTRKTNHQFTHESYDNNYETDGLVNELNLDSGNVYRGTRILHNINRLANAVHIDDSVMRSGIPHPIKLNVFRDFESPLQVAAVAIALENSMIPTISIIEGSSSNLQALLQIACHRRYIYHNSHILFNFRGVREQPNSNFNFKDDVRNTTILRSFITTFLCRRTKLTTNQVQQFFEQQTVFSSAEAVSLGLCDYVYKDRPKRSTGEIAKLKNRQI